MKKQFYLKSLLCLLMMFVGLNAWAETVTYSVSSKTAVNTTGTAPQGSSASYSQTYGTMCQMTSGNTTTLTLSGFDGCTITGVTISVKTNKSSGAGTFTVTIGGTQKGSLSVNTIGSTYTDKEITVTSTQVGSSETIVIAGSCTTKSVYCQSYTITYVPAGKTILGTPANLSSSNVTGTTADLSWDAVSNASSYKVKIGSTEYTTTTNSYNATSLEAETEYKWSVKALAGSSDTYSDGTYSGEASFTTGVFVAATGTYNVSMNNALYGISTGNNGTEQSKVKYGVTIVSGCKSSASSKTYYDTNHIRYYVDSYLKLTAPTGFNITQVVFTANGTWNSGPSASVGTYTNSTKTWTGSSSQVDFSFTDQNRVSSIAVTYVADKVLQSVAVSGTPTKTEYEAGEAFNPAGLTVTGTYDEGEPEVITEGITWSTPALLTAGQTSVDITATVNGITSPSYTVNGLTVKAAKTIQSIAVTGTPEEFWKGDTFNHNGMTVTATWSDGDPTDVTSEAEFSTPDMSTAGQKTVTVTYKGKETSYNIEVKTIENTAETAYTTAQAIEKIKANKDLTTEVYVKGTISKVESFNETYGSITYWLDENAFEIYGGLGLESAKFTAQTDLQEGDQVVVKGIIKAFTKDEKTTYEMDKNNVLISRKPNSTKTTPTITATYKTALTVGDADDEYTVTYNGDGELSITSSNEDVAEAIIVDKDVVVSAKAVGTTTITISAPETENYYAVEKKYTLTVKEAFNATVHTALVAEKDGNYYAAANTIEGSNKYFATSKVYVIDGKVYGVENPSAYAWKVNIKGENAATVENLEGKFLKLNAGSSTDTSLSTDTVSLYTKDGIFYAKEGGRIFAYNSTNSRMASYVENGTYPAAKSIPFATDMYYTRSATSGKYGTICLPYAVAESAIAGAKFYIANVNGNTVELSEVTSLEAGKPYIFLAENNDIILEMSGKPLGTEKNGNLTGVLADTEVPVDAYVMQTKDDVQKFYKVADGKQPTLAANRAYLTTSSSAKALNIGSEDVATAVEALNAITSNTAKIYDINGRELKTLQKGVNIVNGVKVLVK